MNLNQHSTAGHTRISSLLKSSSVTICPESDIEMGNVADTLPLGTGARREEREGKNNLSSCSFFQFYNTFLVMFSKLQS